MPRLATLAPALWLLLWLALSLVPPAHGFGRVVFDPTNWVRNTVTAAESVVQTRHQLEQLEAQLKQLRGMEGADVAGLLPAPEAQLARVRAALEGLHRLHGSVEGIAQAFSRRLQEAKVQDLTWPQYAEREEQRIQRNQARAVARAQEEIAAMERVRQDYEFARGMAERIPRSAGTHEALQHMNVQMNHLLKQTAELSKALVAAVQASHSADQQSQQNVEQQRRLVRQRQLQALQGAREQGERRALEVLRGAPAP